MGLLFYEDLSENIPSVITLKSRKPKSFIDGYDPTKLMVHNTLYKKFIDNEDKVVVPMKWSG